MRIPLVILGILEIPLALISLFPSTQLFKLTNALNADMLLPASGVIFFSVTVLVGLMQLLMGIFSLDKKLGKDKTKIIIVIGAVLGILTIPAILIFIVNPIYGITSSIK